MANEESWRENRYHEDMRVRSYESDSMGVAKAHELCNYLQEAAQGNAHELGYGYDEMLAKHLAWVLNRMRVTIHRYPKFTDALRVWTWPVGCNKLYAWRRFRIEDMDENLLVDADSRWVMLDIKNRALFRLPEDFKNYAGPLREEVFVDAPKKLSAPAAPEMEIPFPVRRGDLDPNGHVNNTTYIQWVAETAPDTILETMRPSVLDIQFKAECRFPEIVGSQSARAGSTDTDSLHSLHVLHRLGDQQEVARAEVIWKRFS